MATAQNKYRQLLKDYLSPALRSRGFVGSGGKYRLPDDKAYVLLGCQKNKWNTEDAVEFTINISVIGKQAWEAGREIQGEWMGKEPRPNVQYLIPV